MKLPDGGAKLKAKLQDIEALLYANNSANSITERVSEMSLDEKHDIRTETVLRSNNMAVPPSNLLRAHSQQIEPDHVSPKYQ